MARNTSCRPLLVVSALAILLAVGCSGDPFGSAFLAGKDAQRDTDAARRANASAASWLEAGNLDAAERDLRKAVKADSFFGPAHNNLGLVYYRRKDYYQAAWEFQYAAKLMPYSAEPRNNLGMVYEATHKLDSAAEQYEKALSIEPDRAEIIGNLARVYVAESRNDRRTEDLLRQLILKDTRPPWVAWAKRMLNCMPSTAPLPLSEVSADVPMPAEEGK